MNFLSLSENFWIPAISHTEQASEQKLYAAGKKAKANQIMLC